MYETLTDGYSDKKMLIINSSRTVHQNLIDLYLSRGSTS